MNEMEIHFDDAWLQGRLQVVRARHISALVSIVVTIVLGGVTFFIGQRFGVEPGSGMMTVWVWALGLSLLGGVISLLAARWWQGRLKKYLPAPSGSLALVLDPFGVRTAQGNVPWAEVAGLEATRLPFKVGHELIVRRTGQPPLVFPLDVLSVRPGTLDAAVRAYTHDRMSVDLRAYDY